MEHLTHEFNRNAERTRQHEMLVWLIFFMLLDADARKVRLARKRHYQRQMAFRFN